MKLLSVNVSPPKEVVHAGKTVTTGIFKEPIHGRVPLRTLNLNGDGQADHAGAGRLRFNGVAGVRNGLLVVP